MKKFSVIVLVETKEDLMTFMSNTDFPKEDAEKIQFIIIDRSLDDDSSAIRELAETEQFDYHRVAACSGISDSYNESMQWIEGQYVCFTNPNIKYDNCAISGIEQAFQNDYKLVSLDYILERTSYKEKEKDAIKVFTDTTNQFMFLPACFISREILDDVSFNSTCEEETFSLFLLNILGKLDYAGYIPGIRAYYNEEYNVSPQNYYGSNNKLFYIDSLKSSYLPILEKYSEHDRKVPARLQRYVLAQLFFKVCSNQQERNKYLLIDDEIDEFFESISKVLQFIDDRIIMSNVLDDKYVISLEIRNLFMCLKYKGNYSILNRRFYIEFNNLIFEQAGQKYKLNKKQQTVNIYLINVKENEVLFDASFPYEVLYQCVPDALYVDLNGKRISVERTGIYSHTKTFGVSINKSYTFSFSVPKKDFVKKGSQLSFWLDINDCRLKLPIGFERAAARIDGQCKESYWMIDDNHIMKYKVDYLYVIEAGLKKRIKCEKTYIKERQNIQNDKKEKRDIFYERWFCFLFKKKLKKKHIWIYFDKLYKNGDNGDYQFRHDIALAKSDKRKCFYILNKTAADYKNMKKLYGRYIVPYGSFRSKIYALCAEAIVATCPDVIEFLGFEKSVSGAFRDIFDAKIICIAHGVTIQKNAEVQNRIRDNTEFYTTSSKYEVNHLLEPIYGYEKNQIALTGMARFDGLKNNDKKQILISPTWRINLVSKRTKRNETRAYKDDFKKSAYYRIYNSLINDERIINASKKAGYKVLFLVHPLMSAQADDYEKNEFVDIVTATGELSYEKILTESSLMVTDYSGIQYDFAYMRKPVIYYQPKEIPMRFEEGAMKFKTMGFGPVVAEYDEVVDAICRCIENRCQMEAEYIKRADDFFAFSDYNNCERIHDAIADWISKQ